MELKYSQEYDCFFAEDEKYLMRILSDKIDFWIKSAISGVVREQNKSFSLTRAEIKEIHETMKVLRRVGDLKRTE